jgi:hypothetical protein
LYVLSDAGMQLKVIEYTTVVANRDLAHRDIRAKNFPFLYEDGPRAVMGVK